MSALKQLSAVYMAAASAFAVAIVLAHHPDLSKGAHLAAGATARAGAAFAAGLEEKVLAPAYGFARDGSVRAWRALAEAYRAPAIPTGRYVPKATPRLAAATPVAPDRIIVRTPPLQLRLAELRPLTVAPRPMPLPGTTTRPDASPPPVSTANLPPADHPPNAAELVRVEQRLKDNLTTAMLANFKLFLYVSKAEKGPWAQRMYVFTKDASGSLALLDDWPVSTGRERSELSASGKRVITDTPQGYYELDANRMYRRYTSHQWHQPMPDAMFFNWVHDGLETGLAIHAAHGADISLLGRRASAGCIHLAPEHAATLFDLIRTKYKGRVPRFAFNRRTGTMSNDGLFLRDAHGKLRYAEGYKVLIFIENYGGENVVAMLM
ncbi:MAG: L,D-transpeptidase family protein [Alphaproteobacteria bacterium]|nr:L,D-transpeptidase family protein [Alphaproteobacteria bacterium]